MPASALGVFGLKACAIIPGYNQKIERENFENSKREVAHPLQQTKTSQMTERVDYY